MIQVKGLGKSYHNKTVVDNISFTVKAGKVTGFVGPNGAGKSTTMRLMLGLDKGQGETTFNKKRLSEYTNPSHIVGILLEAKAFHPTRSAANHLRVLAAAGGIPSSRVAEVLNTVGLSEVATKQPGKFSLGMSQRLGIAAAILGQPKYLLLDEPANGLDPEGIAWLRQFIKDYAAAGNAVFVSSHLLSEMSQMADNVVVIGKGRLIAETPIKDLTASNAHGDVYVRSLHLAKLERLLKSQSLVWKRDNGGLLVSGVKTDDIGRLAHTAGLPVLELTSRAPSLEEAFLQLTAGSEEYKAKSGVKHD